MMDESTIELLSRYLDGDLDRDDERDLVARLEADQTLATELEALERVRNAVAGLAARERVPAELDTLVEPLLRGHPEPVVVRPWARWLATAAVVMLGVTVVIEVNRRNPGPSVESIARHSGDRVETRPTERFTLAPLPTASLPEEERPLGASDRLLASPIPDVEYEDAPPLEVLGPLDEMKADTDAGKGRRRDTHEAPEVLAVTEMATLESLASRAQEIGPEGAAPAPSKREKKGSVESEQGGQAALPTGRQSMPSDWEGERPTGRARLFVFIDGKSAWRDFAPDQICKPGRYTVRIVVTDGAVAEARPVGGAASASPSQRLCAAALVRGLEIEDVADGEYPAEVAVEPRGVGDQ